MTEKITLYIDWVQDTGGLSFVFLFFDVRLGWLSVFGLV